MTLTYPFADVALARRLEHAEGRSNVAFVETRRHLEPGTRATWCDAAGGFAMFDGVGSPLTQTFGLGLFAPVEAADLERLEQFFFERGADVCHEVSPLAGVALYRLLLERRYHPVELASVMFRPLASDGITEPQLGPARVRVVRPAEEELFATVAARGWSETPEAAVFMAGVGAIITRRPDGPCFLAEIDGVPIAAAALHLSNGVALLAGASTVPEARGKGAQLALLRARLEHAAQDGCDLAMMCAAPGSASQRNAERHGFRIAYTRVKWQRAYGPRQ